MSYKDKSFGLIFPTRHGIPIGTSGDRGMLDRMGGSGGYRKDYRTEADGSITRLTTKNGMPQFEYDSDSSNIPTSTLVYMETGQLVSTSVAPMDPHRYDAASWKFRDIATTSKYLGYVAKDGTQLAYQSLSEGQDSQAIGPPKVLLKPTASPAEIAAAEVTDAANKIAYQEEILLKKIISGIFPASMFSGKMRLFMQALYGARAGDRAYPLNLEIAGESILLKYSYGGSTMQFGFSETKTPGIFTASDGSYWLIDISMVTGTCYITYYSITHDASVTDMVASLKAGGLSAAETIQLESYVFAYSYINVAEPKTIVVPGALGASMAWGWKFNSSGSIASVVMHETINSGTTKRWTSRTVDIAFSYSSGVISASSTVTTNGNWIDGWGEFNIFVPYSVTGTSPLELFSLLAFTTATAFTFPPTTIYGYYRDDVWTPVKVSCTLRAGTFPQYEWSSAGIIYDPASYPLTYSSSAPSNGSMMADGSCSYERHEISSGKEMGVSVGSSSYSGKFDFGSHFYYTKSCAQEGEYTNTNGFTSFSVGGAPYVPGPPPGNGGTTSADMITGATVTCMSYSFVGADIKGWALVIPFGDCEAAYVSTHERYTSSAFSRTTTIDGGVLKFHGLGYSYAPYTGAGTSNNGWLGSQGPSYSAVTDSESPAETATYVYCFNTVIAGDQGTPGGSYETLFIVDRDYPVYNRGMYTYTSHGKRYIMSEGLLSPESITTAPFVGWA